MNKMVVLGGKFNSVESITQKYEMLNSRLFDIMLLQHNLNKTMTRNDNYDVELVTKDGMDINYGDCILDELMEVQNCLPWKHWKANTDIDYDNLEMEIVDLFHFIPSSLIVYEVNGGVVPTTENLMEKLLIDADEGSEADDAVSAYTIIHSIKNMLLTSGTYLSGIYYGLKQYRESSDDKVMLDDIVGEELYNTHIFMMLRLLDLHMLIYGLTAKESIDRIYNLYIVKNTLNGFRMANGYKDGSYVKLWDGINEDNVFALQMIKDLNNEIESDTEVPALDSITLADVLYSRLELKYKELTGK